MSPVMRGTVGLFVDRASQRWVVRDPDGHFWCVPTGDDGWMRREPIDSSGDLELEPVPGHYRYLFKLPF